MSKTAITMNQITSNLRRQFVDRFNVMGEQLRKEGQSDYEICKVFNDYVKAEGFKLYRSKSDPKNIKPVIEKVLSNQADSNIELIYCRLLRENHISFDFQFKVGKFRADFIIDKWLDFEIDGPQHDKNKDAYRDHYFRKMGYEVFRVPAWLAAADHRAVMTELKQLYDKGCPF